MNAGRKWAKFRAEVGHLEALENSRDPVHGWGFGGERSAYSDAELFYFIIRPDYRGYRDAAADFWECALGDRGPREVERDGFVEGFADGAMEVWEEVKAEL